MSEYISRFISSAENKKLAHLWFKEDQFIDDTQDKLVSRANEAFKPNGITDNRMEWALKPQVKASTALKTVIHIYKTQKP